MFNNSSVMATELKTQSGWFNSGNGENTKCFSATPAGYRTAEGIFQGITKQTGWWVIPYQNDTTSSIDWVFEIVYDSPKLFLLKNYKSCGYSVRCKKD